MKKILYIALSSVLLLGLSSCQDNIKPNYQYFPNMYDPVGYEAYADSDAFANGIEAQFQQKVQLLEDGSLMIIRTLMKVTKLQKQILVLH